VNDLLTYPLGSVVIFYFSTFFISFMYRSLLLLLFLMAVLPLHTSARKLEHTDSFRNKPDAEQLSMITRSPEMVSQVSVKQHKDSGTVRDSTLSITLFLAGDVMLGRGIDQILLHPGDPILYEPYMKNARGYVRIAEQKHGPIPAPVPCSYVWGDALKVLERISPDLRIINLETSITDNNDYWKNKGIHYRMNPQNNDCFKAAKIDVCALANNHVLDWGYPGLEETLETLDKFNVNGVGAGTNLERAMSPAVEKIDGKGRVLVFSYGVADSGIPPSWAASNKKSGVNYLKDLSSQNLNVVKNNLMQYARPDDIIVLTIHWGGNWGYEIPSNQVSFAHKLIDEAGVDVIHGHSSHHVKGIEVYRGKLILYGSGDFLNDYEGIGGHEQFRGDLSLMYFASIEQGTGKLLQLQMIPTQIKHFRVNQASNTDTLWLRNLLNREGRKLGTQVSLNQTSELILEWR